MTTTRRSVLAGAAAVLPATAAVALPVVAVGGADPFAVLHAKWREAVAAVNGHTWTSDIHETVQQRCPLPEILRALPSDQELGFYPPVCDRAYYEVPADASQFRRGFHWPSEISESQDTEGRLVTTIRLGLPWPEKQKRADGIVAAYDEWDARRRALNDELGAYDADAEFGDLMDELHEIEQQIADVPVTSLSDAVAKARVMVEILKNCEDDLCDNAQETMAMDLVRDIAKLASA